jgi:hypothetical protein
MYKNLSSYIDIANSIKPDMDSGYDSKYQTTINTGMSDFIEASKKLDFRARVEESTGKNPYDIEFSFDKNDEHGRDGFDRFMAGEFNGREYAIDSDDTEDDSDVIDMMDTIEEFDPTKQNHSDWLNSVADKYRDKVDQRFNEKLDERKTNQIPRDKDADDQFDDYVSKHQIPERVHNKMREVVSAMQNNPKFVAKLDTDLPDGYLNKAIEEFTKRTLVSDDAKLHEMISGYLNSDLKASRGDMSQLFDIYTK